MIALFNSITGRRTCGFSFTAALAVLLLPTVARAQTTSFTGDGWINGVPVPGVFTTNAAGQVSLRGNVHTIAFQGSDPRVAGLDLVPMDMSYNADGTAKIQGPAYLQVGSWDSGMTNFTPSGGVWVMNYTGAVQADGSLQLHAAGYGVGGAVEGHYIDVTVTRGPVSNPFDPTVPLHRTGTIQPPPLNTNLLLDDFSRLAADWVFYGPAGSYTYTRTNGQLVVTGNWPGVITGTAVDSYTFGGPPSVQSIAPGETLEGRADLVNLSASATGARLQLGTTSGFYAIVKGHDFILIEKWSASLPWGAVIEFSCEKTQVPDTNVILNLALTRNNQDVVITARVLSKSNPERVLYQHSVVDTPAADVVLTSEEYLNLTGMPLALSPDLTQAPFTTAQIVVGVFQWNDGTLPAAIATYDNLEVRKYRVPPLGIAQTVQLSWPALGNYFVESAPGVEGPWLPVNEMAPLGMRQVTVPASKLTEFFRLRPAP